MAAEWPCSGRGVTATTVQAYGLQSDLAFAKDFARYKWRLSQWAMRRIAYDLKRRGVSREHVEEALNYLQTARPATSQHSAYLNFATSVSFICACACVVHGTAILCLGIPGNAPYALLAQLIKCLLLHFESVDS
jgi:hypothetical protein